MMHFKINSKLCFQLKLKNMVTTQQEKLLGEKEMVVERQKHEIQSLNDELTKKQEEVTRPLWDHLTRSPFRSQC